MVDVSVVVSAHDLRREIPRTVLSLSPPYQHGFDPASVEIIVVDNGSHETVDARWFEGVASPVRILRFPPGNPSPCHALNQGVAAARGSRIVVLIDGARIASPGLLFRAGQAMQLAPDVFVVTLGFHLGLQPQQLSQTQGYGREVEDRLLEEIGWPADGYRLFEICARGESYRDGILADFPETTAFTMHKATFERLGGFHEGFRYRGGGLANFEFFERVMQDPAVTPVALIGEGTFHQVHDGNSTRAHGVRRRETPDGPTIWEAMAAEFVAVTNRAPLAVRLQQPLLFGRCETPAARQAFFPDREVTP